MIIRKRFAGAAAKGLAIMETKKTPKSPEESEILKRSDRFLMSLSR